MLDRVAQRIVEIDHSEMHSYRGGWDAYLEAKAERAALEQRTEANRQNFLRTELEWLRRSPQARTTKQKARIQRVEGVRDQEGPKAQQVAAQLDLQVARTGRTILDVRNLRVERGGKLLIDNLDLCLAKGDRVGIVGGNGAGKTSLLAAVLGQLEPVSGSIKLGETMKVAYFDQTREGLDPEESIFDNVIGNRGEITMGKEVLSSHAYLERFQFPRKRVQDKVKLLSGGERARVALAKLLIEPVNLLLLDEPTNDLDVATLSSLEEMLINTAATAIVVTHDRYFLDRIATSILAFEGNGQVVQYASAHQALEGAKKYRANETKKALAADKKEKAEVKQSSSKAIKSKAKNTLTFAERIELEGIMEKIAVCEGMVSDAETEMLAPTLYTERASEVPGLSAALESAEKKLAEILQRWEFLEDKKGESD